jgi:hypothetical protein
LIGDGLGRSVVNGLGRSVVNGHLAALPRQHCELSVDRFGDRDHRSQFWVTADGE